MAGAILSALCLWMVQAWASLDKMSFDLLLRQKAVFVLNGEMERLSELYTTVTGFGWAISQGNNGYPALANIRSSTVRDLYPPSGMSFTTMVAGPSTTAGAFLGDDTRVLQVTVNGLQQDFVWLDRGRRLAARLSWVACPVTNALATACWTTNGTVGSTQPCYDFGNNAKTGNSTGAGPCMMIILVLEYPYQLQGSVPVAFGVQSTLTLSTIVGLHRDQ